MLTFTFLALSHLFFSHHSATELNILWGQMVCIVIIISNSLSDNKALKCLHQRTPHFTSLSYLHI